MPQTSQQNRKGGKRQQAVSEPALKAATPTPDHVYGLVSVLYHALQGAQTYGQYIQDAQRADDEELVKFFERCRDEETVRAGRAKQLLVDRTELEEDDEDDEVDSEDDEEEDEE